MQATVRHIRITPRKLRLVADLIRGKRIEEAQTILKFCPKRGSYFLGKLLNSAVSNATVNQEVDPDQLYIEEIAVSPGRILKRWRASPRGRGVPIKKRTSHAYITLGVKITQKGKKGLFRTKSVQDEPKAVRTTTPTKPTAEEVSSSLKPTTKPQEEKGEVKS